MEEQQVFHNLRKVIQSKAVKDPASLKAKLIQFLGENQANYPVYLTALVDTLIRVSGADTAEGSQQDYHIIDMLSRMQSEQQHQDKNNFRRELIDCLQTFQLYSQQASKLISQHLLNLLHKKQKVLAFNFNKTSAKYLTTLADVVHICDNPDLSKKQFPLEDCFQQVLKSDIVLIFVEVIDKLGNFVSARGMSAVLACANSLSKKVVLICEPHRLYNKVISHNFYSLNQTSWSQKGLKKMYQLGRRNQADIVISSWQSVHISSLNQLFKKVNE